MKRVLLFSSILTLLSPAPLRPQEITREGDTEKCVLFGPETAKEWSAAESTMDPSSEHVKVGRAALRWHVTVDYTAGDSNYLIGWPRTSHPIPEGPARDWSAWDFLHTWIYVETSREALPGEPVVLILHTPDRAGAYNRPLSELKKGEWVEINIPLAKVPRHSDVRLLQLSISEANYRHQDRLDLYIDDLALLRYARPTLLDLAAESPAMFADASRIPVRFRLAGVGPGQSAEVTCDLSRGGQVTARASVRAGRGPGRLILDLGGKGLKPGAYELTARVAGGREVAAARVRLVESPWR